MTKKPKRPLVPAERHETIRRDIETLLEGKTMSAMEISSEVGIREKRSMIILNISIKVFIMEVPILLSPRRNAKVAALSSRRGTG